MNVFTLVASAAIVLASIPSVLGTGYITGAAAWKDGYAVNSWGSSIDGNMWDAIDNSVYGYGTSATVAFFEAKLTTIRLVNSSKRTKSCKATTSMSNAVIFDYNCQEPYPDIPAGIPYDEALCADANRLTIYWLAVHGAVANGRFHCRHSATYQQRVDSHGNNCLSRHVLLFSWHD
ncbi:Hypothetical protein PHPALM_20658 [Phytophthora palmivora]|uniref:Uncharacterized protein n=1 Tax=Phytophthora palmivora TaxID=4796 RepID=A0A2P4XEB7_9STRA|nr:Hypothetical protein PHPALM_20658 [Phytophthora palmivora]